MSRNNLGAEHVAQELFVVRQPISGSGGQQIKVCDELDEALPSLFECVQLGHGGLFFCGVLKEICQD